MRGSPRSDRPLLREALRLLVVTDAHLAAPRSIHDVTQAALSAGARAFQIRAKGLSARELLTLTHQLHPPIRRAGALLFLNDRADVALAAGADGVHLGPNDPPLRAIRQAAPSPFLIGYSTDDPDQAIAAAAAGADYIGCGAVWGTTTKDVGGEAIGIDRLRAVARSVSIPVVAIGGITAVRAQEVARTEAVGVAVVGAIMSAADPASATRSLLDALETK